MARVLFVEDDHHLRLLSETVLSKENHEVHLATNGLDALRCLQNLAPNKLPDVIVVDIMMPEMDGYTLIQKLQEDPETRSIPVVVLTTQKQMEDLLRMSSNVRGFVPKPFDFKDLIQAVNKASNKH